MKQLWDSIAPQAQEEHRRVQEQIRAELTPEQQKAFDEIMKRRLPNKSGEEWRHREERRDPRVKRTNAPLSQPAPAGTTRLPGNP